MRWLCDVYGFLYGCPTLESVLGDILFACVRFIIIEFFHESFFANGVFEVLGVVLWVGVKMSLIFLGCVWSFASFMSLFLLHWRLLTEI